MSVRVCDTDCPNYIFSSHVTINGLGYCKAMPLLEGKYQRINRWSLCAKETGVILGKLVPDYWERNCGGRK